MIIVNDKYGVWWILLVCYRIGTMLLEFHWERSIFLSTIYKLHIINLIKHRLLWDFPVCMIVISTMIDNVWDSISTVMRKYNFTKGWIPLHNSRAYPVLRPRSRPPIHGTYLLRETLAFFPSHIEVKLSPEMVSVSWSKGKK